MSNQNIGIPGLLSKAATPEHPLDARSLSDLPDHTGALSRRHLRNGAEATAQSAKLLLEAISELPQHEFWPDEASYLELPTAGIIGHRQVTDAYLVLLAQKHGGTLATMDAGLAAIHASATLIP